MNSARLTDWKVKTKRLGVLCLATGGFTGYFPVASGTVGSFVGLGFVWLFWDLQIFFQIALCLFLSGVGVWASHEANLIFGKADARYIVIDEIAGVMITLIGMPVTSYWLICGFIVFRILDIVKLPPANYFDSRVKNGWGVMLDDILSGVYGNILLHLMMRAQI